VARFFSRARLTVADVSVTEGDSATTPAVFTVTLSRPLSQPALICAVTFDITAVEPRDYSSLAQCQLLQPGPMTLTFTVTVKGDHQKEADETFAFLVLAPFVRLADPIAIGTIQSDD
jgi:hypothetical protein